MNYFEAYRIVQAYTKALAMPKSKYDMLYPLSSLVNTKEEIWDAYKLFLAHIYIYKSRTLEEFERIITQPTYLEMFYDDALANRVNYLSNYIKKDSLFIPKFKRQQAEKELNQIIPKDLGTLMLRASSRVDRIIEKLEPIEKEYWEAITKPDNQNINYLLSIAKRVYESFSLPHTPDDDVTFLPYRLHRRFINDDFEGAKEFYTKYLDIVFDERNI